MLVTQGYAVEGPTSAFKPFQFNRRELKPHDVLIKISHCGICHSDLHMARNEWNSSTYPMVPGHEIVGQVIRVGTNVTRFKANDTVGVGCFVDSCRECSSCKDSEQQFCEKHLSLTYGSTEQDTKTPTYGGYSSQIVVDEQYVLRVSPKLTLSNVAPLLCAGITTYSPLKRFNVGPGKRVAILGLGGLGHMGVKLAVSMGADVTVLSTSPTKEQDARRLGAHHFIVTKDPKQLEKVTNYFDFILDTVSAPHDVNLYLSLLRRRGVMVVVGVPPESLGVQPFSLIRNQRSLVGSLIGGLRETQEMLDYCADNNITADIEIIPIQKIEDSYERMVKGDVRYRFVIDMNSLN